MANGRTARRKEPAKAADARENGDSWATVVKVFRSAESPLPQPWEDIFGPLRKGAVDDLVVVGQCGQSIDARIATPSGDSHYVNGEAGLEHLHRLRALMDAVVIGVGTAVADNPQLTVRRVRGPNPARVIIDPKGRLPPTVRALADDGIRRLVITATPTPRRFPADVEIVALAADNGAIAPAAIARSLAEHGFRRILIEGGAETVSRFLAAHCLDRLHVLVAPVILGAGRASLNLPALQSMRDAKRLPMRAHLLKTEVLLDCDLSAQRIALGRAKMSR